MTFDNSDKQQNLQSEENTDPPRESYTVLSRRALRGFQLLLGLATITSPLTATIYLPLLPLLREQYNVSAQAINQTLTIYVIFQAISPVIFGPLSDMYGRRPLFLLTLAIYLVGNIGLALNEHNYGLLLFLRAVQSLGASAAYAIAFGVVADVCESSDRGWMLGPLSMALNLGACVGPVVGGAVAYSDDSQVWVFWALVIVAAVLFLAVGSLLPETARGLVGNGSHRERFGWWQQSWLGLAAHRLKGSKTHLESPLEGTARRDERPQSRPSPLITALKKFLACFRIIFYKDTFFTVWMHGSFYTVDYSFTAALPGIYEQVYHWNELYVGLAYLPRGLGIISGSYFTGRNMDHNYRKTTKRDGLESKRISGDDMLSFPIEVARTRSSYYLLIISTLTMVGYGWAIHFAAHPAVPLTLQFLQGFWGTYFYTTYSALLVDVFPESPSTASAATSVARCAMAAAGLALLQPLLDAAGRVWYFTVLGLWSGLFGAAAVWVLRSKGMVWRRRRHGLED